MLHFPCPLTPAAMEVFRYCLGISADLARADMPDDEWAMAYPLSAKGFTRQRTREVLLDLLDKLRLPQEYVPDLSLAAPVRVPAPPHRVP